MTAQHIAYAQLSESEHRSQLRRAIIASTIGTAIEWYDFFLYSVVTGLVFAKLFILFGLVDVAHGLMTYIAQANHGFFLLLADLPG